MIHINFIKKFYKMYLSKYKIQLTFSCFLALASGIMLAYAPKKIGELTSIVYQGIVQKAYGKGGIDYETIKYTFLFVLFIYLIAFIGILIEERIVTNVIQNCIYNLKNDIFKKITKIKLSVFEKNEDIKNIYNEIDVINKYLNIIVGQALLLFSVIIGSIVFAFTINSMLALLTLILIPLLTIGIRIISEKYNKKISAKIEIQKKLDEEFYDLIYKNKLINLFNCNKKKLKDLYYATSKNNKINQKCRKTIMNTESYSSLMGNLVYVLILYVGIYLNSLNMITIGDIQSFILYNKLIERPVFVLSKISNIFYAIKDSFNKIFKFFDLDDEESFSNTSFTNGDISLNNLNFGYNKELEVLHDINLKIKQGERIAIIGKTGSGKSTLVKLLSRFYDSYLGDIYINNNNIKDLDLYEYRKQIGIVPQDIWVFNGTIMENITYGSNYKKEKEIIELCKKIKLHEMVNSLPEKYNTKINEDGSNISFGLKQLINIARLMLKNPQIVFLDEATNMLDYKTETYVKDALNEFLKNKTSIIIAHRLSTITNSDRIVVIDDGKVLESGTNEELLAKKGQYYKMYNEWAY